MLAAGGLAELALAEIPLIVVVTPPDTDGGRPHHHRHRLYELRQQWDRWRKEREAEERAEEESQSERAAAFLKLVQKEVGALPPEAIEQITAELVAPEDDAAPIMLLLLSGP